MKRAIHLRSRDIVAFLLLFLGLVMVLSWSSDAAAVTFWDDSVRDVV